MKNKISSKQSNDDRPVDSGNVQIVETPPPLPPRVIYYGAGRVSKG
jgi:hypothetical protein